MLKFRSVKTEADSEWISISDLMSVLMMIFLFIAISYMHNVQRNQLNVKKVAVAYQELQTDLYRELWEEFKEDLPNWKAIIEKETLTIRFEEPEVLFSIGSAEITDKFQLILEDFFPRYVRIISSDKYRNNIEEIRIEGHTSSEWVGEIREMEAYFNNMSLSQNRTRSVLKYCLSLIKNSIILSWAQQYITANGLSSSHLIKNKEGIEDKEKSRRVEFRTKTNAEKKVVEIIEHMEKI
ncbi:MAG: OmpA family protein [Deltaproteobacteria bacterium]|nr:OmpA family protein [Deltaproteobacteria bacterium]